MKTAASIHRAAEKGNSRKLIYWMLNPYPMRPGQWRLTRSPAVPEAMYLATRLDRYSPPNGERSSEVASLLEELYVRVLPREGEPTVLREAEEVLLLVVDEVRDLPLLAQCHLKAVKSLGPPSAPLLLTAKLVHHPPNNLRQKLL